MDKRRWAQVAVVVVFLIFTALFWRFELHEVDCDWDDDTICVSFCSSNERELPDSFIKENFFLNNTLIDFFEDFKIVRGKPLCLNTKVFDPKDYKDEDDEDDGMFSDMRLQTLYFTPHQYCKEKVERNGRIQWDTIVCVHSQTGRFIFHGFVIVLSVIILAFTLSVYLYYEQLRDFHGMCIIHFLLPLLLMFLFQPIVHYDEYFMGKTATYITIVLEIFYVFAFLWISVMCFDMFWTFLKLHKSYEDIPNRLRVYMLFVYSATLFSTIVYIVEVNSYTIFEDFVTFLHVMTFLAKFITAIDVILFALAIWFKYQCMRNFDADNYAIYETENQWFWIRFQIIAVLLATFPIEIYSLQSDNVFEVFLIADFMKLFCCIVVSAIAILGRDDVAVLVIEKYNEFKSRSGGMYFVNSLA